MPRPTISIAADALIVAMLGAPLVVGFAALSGIGHRWVDILAQFTAPAMAATVVILVLSLATLAVPALRLKMAAGASVVVALVLLIAGWPQWFPPKGVVEPGAPGFTLYSANVWALNTNIEAMARSVEASDADVVMLVEAGDRAAERLDRIVGGYPYRWVGMRHEGPKGASRYVFASRWPIEKVYVPAEQLDAEGVRAQTPLGPVTILAVHLTRPWPYQFQWGQIIQARGIATWRKATPGPMVVAGDFNSVSSARIGRQIQAETGMIPAPGWPGTWHSALPSAGAITIDQVYRSPDLALTERRLGLRNGSDHRPVITGFKRAAPRAE